MTNEQAATKLTNIAHDDHYSWHPSILEAFSMAVDALRGAEVDCISRQAAIARAVPLNLFGREVMMVSVSELENLPSAQPEQRWIPVTERLPEPLQEVLVTSTRGYVYTSRIVHGDFEYGGNVIAWMPLPEPYGGDNE